MFQIRGGIKESPQKATPKTLVGFRKGGGCSRGGGNWGTLMRIPFGKIGVHLREHEGRLGESPPHLRNPTNYYTLRIPSPVPIE